MKNNKIKNMTLTAFKTEAWSSVGKQVSEDHLDYLLALDFLSDIVLECTDLKTLSKIHHIRDVLMKERNKVTRF